MNNKLWESIQTQNSKDIFAKTINRVTQMTLNITQNFLECKNTSHFDGFSVNQLQNLKILKRLGEGAFSEVFHAIDQDSKQEYAIRLSFIDNKKFPLSKAQKEMNVVKQLNLFKHKNIIQIHQCNLVNENDKPYLQMVMELGQCTLEEVMLKRRAVNNFWSEEEILKIAFGLISALNTATNYGVSHRDLSLNNVILSRELDEYKLIDFGEGLHFIENQSDSPIVGKFYFMAPELLEIVNKIQAGHIGNI